MVIIFILGEVSALYWTCSALSVETELYAAIYYLLLRIWPKMSCPGWIYHLWLVAVWLVSMPTWLATEKFYLLIFVSGPFALSSTLASDWRRISLFPLPVSSPLIRGLPSTPSVLHQPLYSVSHELFSSILSVSMPHECCTIGCLLQSSELLCAFLTLTQ